MTYGLTATEQISDFLSASGLGLIVCLIYYAFAFVRSAVSERTVAYIVSDTLFCAVTAFCFFVFFQVHTYGEVRTELLLSAAVSFFVYRRCFITLFSGVFRRAVSAFSAFLKAFFFPVTSLTFAVRKILKKSNKKEK